MPEDVVDWLANYRLREGISYQTLARRMTAAGFRAGWRGLHWAMTDRSRGQRETTRYRWEGFRLHILNQERRKRLRKKARRATAASQSA
jgi:transposase